MRVGATQRDQVAVVIVKEEEPLQLRMRGRALRARFREQDGAQPGDPALAAEAIIATVRAGSAPLRLPLGKESVDRIRAKLERQLADLEVTEELSLSTAFVTA